VLTSGEATAAYLATVAPPGAPIYPIGEEGLRRTLTRHGFTLVEDSRSRAEYVVVGWDRQLSWAKLAEATLLINAGARLVGTNPDRSYPTERGVVPGNGAQLAALEAASGVKAFVVGKPEPWMYEEAMRRMDARPETTAVIGDRLDTDIPGGVRLGLTTALVLSGIASEADLAASPFKPDVVAADIGALTRLWDTV
jgi:4-nitrophenyl phosphatase